MTISDGEKPLEEFLRIRAAADRQKIDQLHEQPGAARACPAHRFRQLTQTRQKAVVPDAQERPARHVADAGRLDHDGARRAAREPLVPFEHVLGDIALLGSPPRHHGGNPGALLERDRADIDRREQPRRGGFGGRGHVPGLCFKSDPLRWSPHCGAQPSFNMLRRSLISRGRAKCRRTGSPETLREG